ncbi:MAG: methyltransferase domain-containing protein [Alphaproteobacteria bacterium]|uniref:methyltransferase domain-containing protein n=1 Tax=Pyruvatibacter sp. HU-CL02332 TaxID=3127650 RepID=UPI002969101B|nr:methyltransferase domain-containing protein [Alphaproteobacteria bacterium]
MSWDPSIYLKFDDKRTRPAAELLGRVPADHPQNVVDLGCGPGNSTALLAARWPQAKIAGVDSSQEMLDKAASTDIPATWTCADIAAWQSSEPVDVLFTNAALHWLGDHHRLFPSLMNNVAPGGTLAIQMPRNFDAPSHTLLHETVEETGNPNLIALLRDNPVADPDIYHRILTPHAASVDIWETTYLQVLTGEDAVLAWTSGTALVPFMSVLEGAECDRFIGNYRQKLAAAYPPEADGSTLFAFKRIFIVAQKH